MTAWNIIVADLGDGSRCAIEYGQRLLAAWTEPVPLRVTARGCDDLDDEDLSGVDAVVLIGDRANDVAHALGQLSVLEEEAVPVLALVDKLPTGRHPYEFAGALIEAADQDLPIVRAKLHGMLHRQAAVRRLREEISVAYRFHGGLRGEIARMHDELQLAAMVQREFLPRELPRLCGVEFAALWRPAHYVSGDIYDVSRLDDDHIGIFIADAVGHGVPAALMTMVICRSLKTKIINGDGYELVEPSEVLARLNHDLIRRRGHTTRFATGAYAVVNCRERTMRFAGAGHPPPLLQKADGTARDLETPGGLLGVFEDESYDQIELQLDAGDRLLLHSDGFEQAFPTDEADDYQRRLPTQRYREEFERLAQQRTPAEIVEAVSERLDDQQGSLHQIDDLTLICMHAGPLDAASDPDATSRDHARSRAA